jgi:hypothetical protein
MDLRLTILNLVLEAVHAASLRPSSGSGIELPEADGLGDLESGALTGSKIDAAMASSGFRMVTFDDRRH